MCGICGIARFTDRPVEPDVVARACEALRHRGPDHAGLYVDRGRRVGLGATRLAVLDPSAAAHQPMHRSNGRYHLIYNGEIYNYRELRRELVAVGESFHTESDTEVVLAACGRWGVDALGKFNGMFALAFYDEESERGFVARDRFGIKPLLIAECDDGLVFASEFCALKLLGAFDRRIDGDSLASHLQYGYIAHPRTIFRGARRLPPGCFLEFFRERSGEVNRYYTLPGSTGAPPLDYGEARRAVRRALADAVVRRRVSDVPIGAYLSGGLDSSIIVAHLAEAVGRPVTTFCVGYEGAVAYDESGYARLVADRFHTDHHELKLTEREVVDAVPSILDHLGEPVGDSSIIPTTLISRLARREVTVALSGDGGDELFGGYWRYLGHQSLDTYLRLPRWLRARAIEPILARASVSKSSALGNRARQFRKMLRGGGADAVARHVAWSRILAPEAEDLFGDPSLAVTLDQATVEHARQLTAGFATAHALQRVFAFDVQHQLPADMLQKVDLASMSQSLEVRVPFLDHHVVESVMSLPVSYKVHRGTRKRILIDAYRGILPDDVLDRPKQGFEVPIGEFLRGPLRDMFFDVVSRPMVESLGMLSYGAVTRLYDEHLKRRAEHADVLFALLSLCWWKRREDRGL